MKRSKGCINPECKIFRDGKKWPEEYVYCPMCGSELKYVCNDNHCYNVLDNSLQEYCDDCLEKMAKKKQERKELRDKTVDKISDNSAAILAVAVPLAKKGVSAAAKIIKK